MVARWGLQCPDLQAALKRQYQRSQFEIYNHALSGSRAGNALWRITHRYPTTLDDYDAYRAEQAEQVEDQSMARQFALVRSLSGHHRIVCLCQSH